MREVILDLEANGLKPTKIWVVVCKDMNTNEVFTFKDPLTFLQFAKGVKTWIGHNIIGFDLKVLSDLWAFTFEEQNVVDTLVVSRLIKYALTEGHSLESWGNRLGFPKGNFNGDWSQWSQEMEDYCKRDVEVTHKLYDLLNKKYILNPNHKDALELEHFLAFRCNDMTANGFTLDVVNAIEMKDELDKLIGELDGQIVRDFKPRATPIRVVTPRTTKSGEFRKLDLALVPDGATIQEGCQFTLFKFEEFNPNSPRQVIDRLWEAGWNPHEKTDGHKDFLKDRKNNKNKEKQEHWLKYGWKLSETNFATLPENYTGPCRILIKRMLLETRRRKLVEWLEILGNDGKIHGLYNHIGAWTHRMAHVKPNTANISAEKSIKFKTEELSKLAMDYGKRMRKLWVASPDTRLVGTDAEGIQLRIFGHLINDKDFIDALVSGNKEDKSDIHSVNKNKLGHVCKTRDNAKTFIYAFLLGAGTAKVADIFGCSFDEATTAKEAFIEAYPGLKKLKLERLPQEVRRGYILGIDKRPIVCDSEHLALGGHLQSGEKIIMTKALQIWTKELTRRGIWYRLINFVHDEWVTEIQDYDNVCEIVKEVQKDSIRQAGEYFNLNCPLAGSSGHGYSWYDIH